MYSNLINLSGIKAIDNHSEALEFRASFVNGKWYGVKNGNKHEVFIPSDISTKYPYVFSTEANDYWKEVGTARERTKINELDHTARLYWAPFKQGMTLKGVLLKNQIHIVWSLQIKIAKKEYDRQSNRAARKVTGSNKGTNEVPPSEETST